MTDRVLRVDGPAAKKLRKALSGKKPRDAALALIAKLVDPKRPPEWLAFTGKGPLDDVVHLEAPIFVATGADEDEFWSEPGKDQIVFDAKGACGAVSADGESGSVKLSPKDLKRVTAYDAGGFLLANIEWIDAPPADFAKCKKLLATAVDAYSGDMSPYEREEEPKTKGAPSIGGTDASKGGAYLGGPARTGRFTANVSRTKPKIVWTSNFEGNAGAEDGGSCVVDGDLIFAGDAGFKAKCSATTLKGKSVWQLELSTGQSWIVGHACVDRGVVYQPTNQGLCAIDAKTGKLKWMAKLSGTSGSPIVVGDRVFIGSGEGLFGLSIENGRKQWKLPVKRDEYKFGVRGALAYADGTFYFIAEDKLFAVDIETAKARWTTKDVSARAVPTVDESSVYTWTRGGVTAIDRATGKIRWAQKVEGFDRDKTIAIADDRVVTRAGGKLVAFDKKNGKPLWSFAATKKPYNIGSASPIIAGDVVLCALVEEQSTKTELCAVDLATGKELWRVSKFPLRKNEEASLSYYTTPWVCEDGTILVQAYGIQALR